MSDPTVLAALVVGFAALVTTHVTIVFGLATHAPRWRALAALLVPPLAPWWAARERMHVRAGVWVLAALVYGAALVLATRR